MKRPIWIAALGLMLATAFAQAQTFYVTDKVLVGVYEEPNTESTLVKAMPTGTPLEILERSDAFVKVRSPDGTTGWVENSYLIDHKPAQLVVLELTDKQKQSVQQLALLKAELQAIQQQLDTARQAGDGSNAKNADHTAEIKRLKSTRSKLRGQLEALHGKIDAHEKTAQDAKQQIGTLQKQLAALQNKAGGETAVPALLASFDDEDMKNLHLQNQKLTKTLGSIRQVLDLPSAGTSDVVKNGTVQVKMAWLVIGILLLIMLGFIAGMKWLDWRNLQRHGGFRI